MSWGNWDSSVLGFVSCIMLYWCVLNSECVCKHGRILLSVIFSMTLSWNLENQMKQFCFFYQLQDSMLDFQVSESRMKCLNV